MDTKDKVSKENGSSEEEYHKDDIDDEFHDANENISSVNVETQKTSDSKQLEAKTTKGISVPVEKDGSKESESAVDASKLDREENQSNSSEDSSNTNEKLTPEQSKGSEDSVEPFEAKQTDSATILEASPDVSTDTPTGTSPKVAPETSPKVAPEKSTDTPTETSPKGDPEKCTDKTTETSTNVAPEPSTDTPTEKSPEETQEESTDTSPKVAPETSTDTPTEKSPGETQEESTDTSPKVAPETSTDTPTEIPHGEAQEESPEEQREASKAPAEASVSTNAIETSGSPICGTSDNSKESVNSNTAETNTSDKENGNPDMTTSQYENSQESGCPETTGSTEESVTNEDVENKESEKPEMLGINSEESETLVEDEGKETPGAQDHSQEDAQSQEVDQSEQDKKKQPDDHSEEHVNTPKRLVCSCDVNLSMTSSPVDPGPFGKQSQKTAEPKVIEYWCGLCSTLCCKKCANRLHSHCSHVSKCDNVEVKMKDVLKERRESITKNLDELEKAEPLSTREKEVLRNKEEVLAAITKTCDDVIRLAKEKEKELRADVEYLTLQQLEDIQKDEIKRKETLDEYNRSLKEVSKSIESDNVEEVYAIFNTFSHRGVESKKGSLMSSTKRVVFYKDEKLRYLPREFELGTIDLIGTNRSKATDYSLMPLNPVDISNISEATCDPDDIVVVMIDDSEVLVVTDYVNECVKAFYTSNGEPRRSQLDLYYRPHSITAMTNNFLAVCYWNHNQITFIKATAKLTEWRSAVTRKDYKCIAALDSQTLAAGSSHPSVIDIIDLQGRVKSTIADPYDGWTFVDIPRSMCTINGNILISDAGSKSLYCLTRQGEEVFQYVPENDDVLQWPRGVAVTGTGNILLADRYNHKILQLTATGEYVKDLLAGDDGLLRPQGLFVLGEKLYVSQEEDSSVKVFKLSELCDE